MFKNWIRNIKDWWFNRFYQFTLTPKGQALMNYVANDLSDIPQQRIDIYDEAIRTLEAQGITKEEFFRILVKGSFNAYRKERGM